MSVRGHGDQRVLLEPLARREVGAKAIQSLLVDDGHRTRPAVAHPTDPRRCGAPFGIDFSPNLVSMTP
ncbi:MAG: hypothetical protein GWN79_10525 [Actinobacteria bacterium]|nr:hypothetical protein [Actinomycetota bacterium]NIS31661.1 hypothetical protein [Actinomycetota bacterium]NIU19489.1 hypothetical protein [Actinomycetota bacterium]NIU66771.1 hypothetical protein [Actinomycetota bacterium]NIV55977.1 hypothetical protein [Actinomycetota bacterium]